MDSTYTENKIWRLDTDNLAAYTEDRGVMAKIRRSYPDFAIMARYYRGGELIGLQYRVLSRRKRSIVRLLGMSVTK